MTKYVCSWCNQDDPDNGTNRGFDKFDNISDLNKWITDMLAFAPNLEFEYFEVVNKEQKEIKKNL